MVKHLLSSASYSRLKLVARLVETVAETGAKGSGIESEHMVYLLVGLRDEIIKCLSQVEKDIPDGYAD